MEAGSIIVKTATIIFFDT